MHMRESRVLKKLRAGQVASAVKINFADIRVTEIGAMCGFDCLWLDMEHVLTELHTIENQIRSAKIYDVDVLVRAARGSYSDFIHPLEADAAGIMIPHVMSLQDAKKVVWQTRFHPIGRRPIDGGNQDGKYCMVDLQEYIKTANEQRFVVVQIEDPEPLDDLEEIAKLDGIDMLFFGSADFSHGIGAPGQWDHPKITETRKRIAEVALANGKFAGINTSIEGLPEMIDMGYRFICVGADVIGIADYFRQITDSFKDIKL